MQFQQADLAMFMTSFSSIATLIGHMKRALGVSQLYSGQNYYYPKQLLTAMGIEPDSIIGKQDLVRMQLNDSILSFNALKIPDFMAVYKRQYALAHNVYADEDSTFAQLSVFVPLGYYKYVDTESKLDWITLSATTNTADDILSAIEGALDAWRSSSDLGLISGSIQRAFSENALISLDYATSADVVLPVVDRNITWQISNMTALRLNQSKLDITQDPVANTLVFEPELMDGLTSMRAYANRPIKWLNSYDGQTDSEFIMEATRLMQCPNPDVASYKLFNANTELVESFRYYRIVSNNGVPELVASAPMTSVYVLTVQAGNVAAMDVTAAIELLTNLSQFKNGPTVELYLRDFATNDYTYYGRAGDLYRYTTIDGDSLAGLNKAALQSAFGVNQLG
uniref:Capsid n=1 Tax=viral metagenome TaxID=1070528 RepID=A0A2V0RM00_9ZZZZ